MTRKESIIAQLKAGVPLSDAQLASRLRTTHQAVNQACRQLDAAGVISRTLGPDGFLVNGLAVPPAGAAGVGESRDTSNAERGAAFELLAASVLGHHFDCPFQLRVPLLIGDPAKSHRFDLVSVDGTHVGECKSFSWTSGGNIPSAKITTVTEAVFYLTHVPEHVYRFVVLRRDLRPRNRESLAEYYLRTNGHLLAGVHVLEIDVESGGVIVVGE